MHVYLFVFMFTCIFVHILYICIVIYTFHTQIAKKSLEIQEKVGLFKTQLYEILVTVPAWKITRTAEQGHLSFF